MSAVRSLLGVNPTWHGQPNSVEIDPGRVKTFFILQNYTQPGVIHVDATI
jgi:hypothetical protein